MIGTPSEPAGRRTRAAALARGVLEGVVIALVCLAPWALGSVHPAFEGLLYAGVGLVLVLWAARALLEGTLHWRRCPVAVCLAGLFLLGVVQVAPLPRTVLTHVSPATASLYDALLPAERESLPPPQIIPPVPLPVGETFSLSPSATRAELVRLLAVFLLFVAVRYNTAPGRLGRLAVACTVNGAALALFAFLQFLSSPRGLMYWSIPETDAAPFGPFIDRDHFAFYVNLCIGLTVGLLLARRRGVATAAEAEENGPVTRQWWGVFELLNDTAALWIILALALMLAAVAFSLSRGGLIALAGGCVLCLLLRAARSSRPTRWGGALLATALALSLVTWLGTGPLRARLATLWEGDALQDSRVADWATVLPAVRDFPFLGTGYGTFEYVELLYRTDPSQKGWVIEHAHNDYLEALVEGGVVRLLLSVAAILFVYRLGWRALRRYRGQAAEGLVLGALLGFTTVVVHSFVDFGLHIPAVAALAAVVAAHVAALGEKRRTPANGTAAAPAAPSWGARVLALAAVGTAPVLAVVLCAEGWRMARAESLRLGARRQSGDAGLALIEAATQAMPEMLDLHLEAGQAYARGYEAERAQATAARQYLLPALAHFVQARDLCPISARAQLLLAVHGDGFARADPRGTYLERAERVSHADPELYYLAGTLELADRQHERAVASWQRSLALSDVYQQAIVEHARGVLTDEELLTRVLPDRPGQLFAAAAQLYPEPDAPGRRPFYEKALQLLSEPGAVRSPADRHLQAVLHEALGERDEAAAAYEAALERAPREVDWRCEYAQLLRRQGRLEDARRQLSAVLADQPGHPEGLRLMHAVARDMAER
jgi:O-antigen ligase